MAGEQLDADAVELEIALRRMVRHALHRRQQLAERADEECWMLSVAADGAIYEDLAALCEQQRSEWL